MRRRLSDDEIAQALLALPGWSSTADGFIRRTWHWQTFDRAIDFINQIADIARTLDHHPNLTNVYDRVEIALQTHDSGGVTATDIEFATRVNAIA